jgi:hypothetical protein
MIAFNHARAQILAPHREVDPWEGLDRSAAAGAGAAGAGMADRAPDAIGEVPADAASTSSPTGTQDPWGTGQREVDTGIQDPWGFEREAAPPTPASEPSNPWGGPGGDPWGAGTPRKDDELIG